MNEKIQISDSVILATLLALSGGFMDAYSYIGRDQVFANAQTGNMILLGLHVASGEWNIVPRYLTPIFFFAFGVFITHIFKSLTIKKLHWRQISILIEIIILSSVAFISQSYNVVANSLISFACGIQVASFRKVHGYTIATTMCIGNLRSGIDALAEYAIKKNRHSLRKSGLYFLVILIFIMGAVLGDFCLSLLHEKSIIVSSVLLMIGFFVMFIDIEHK